MAGMAPALAEAAPAKVNLALHVTGRRADGYHLLDSLVVFAGVGDRIGVAPAADLRLQVTGPFAAEVPAGPGNLVLQAAAWLAAATGVRAGAAITLDKHLPPASGIGGGSADAAAALRALARLWGVALPRAAATAAIGADLPVCLDAPAPQRMTGIGEGLAPLPSLPPAWLVLANPGRPVPTAAVFAGLARRDGSPLPAALPPFADAAGLAAFLARQRNDLEAPARAIEPAIGRVLAALGAAPGALLVRMSGSGATCFALFAGPRPAREAAARIAAAEPGWWVRPAAMLGG